MMSLGIIGGADGATAVFVSGVFVTGSDPKFWAMLALGGVLAYLLGSVDFGILVSKYLYHDDIRTHGSGNAGSTNILRTFGLKAALLTALGDIGKHFPDTDEAYAGADSMKLLEHVVALLHAHHARVTNADVTIVAQKPKLLPYISQMRSNVACVLGLDEARVNIKATTTEKLGFEGAQEGISAQAVCMVQEY